MIFTVPPKREMKSGFLTTNRWIGRLRPVSQTPTAFPYLSESLACGATEPMATWRSVPLHDTQGGGGRLGGREGMGGEWGGRRLKKIVTHSFVLVEKEFLKWKLRCGLWSGVNLAERNVWHVLTPAHHIYSIIKVINPALEKINKNRVVRVRKRANEKRERENSVKGGVDRDWSRTFFSPFVWREGGGWWTLSAYML